jgi:hypothetical protein
VAHRTTIWRRQFRIDDNPQGRREKNEARRSKILDRVATWIADRRMENGDGDPNRFDRDSEIQYCRKKIEDWNRPAEMIAIAAACALRSYSIEKEMMISRRMVHYWKHHEDFDDVVKWIGSLTYSKFRPPS